MVTLAEAVAAGRGTERPFHCPVHDDHNASASVNVLKGVWFCFACGASGRTEDAESTLDITDVVTAMRTRSAPATPRPDTWLDLFDAHHSSPYWGSRYSRTVAAMFRCGTHPVTGDPTYPLRAGPPPHAVLGVVIRRKEGEPKYLYPQGTSTSTTMFGIERATMTIPAGVILCEGASDVMALYHAGAVPNGWVALGCYGAGVHAPQRELLTEYVSAPRVIAAFNNDEAGRRATETARTVTKGATIDWTPHPDVNDLGDLTPQQRRAIVSEAHERITT